MILFVFLVSTSMHKFVIFVQFSRYLSVFFFAVLESSFNLALPLQAFGSVSVFERSEDFPHQAFGCPEALHMSQMWQDSKFDLHSVLKANFHEEFNDGQTFQAFKIHPPYLFYIRSRAEPALIHLLGRILN